MELSISKIMHYLNNEYAIITSQREFVEHDLEKEEQKKVRDEKYIRELEDDYNFKDGQVDMLTKIIKEFKVIETVEWRWCERKNDKC